MENVYQHSRNNIGVNSVVLKRENFKSIWSGTHVLHITIVHIDGLRYYDITQISVDSRR